MPARVYLFAAVPILLWGTSFAAAKIVVRDLSPAGVVLVRAWLGLAVLGIALALTRRPAEARFTRTDVALIAVMGVIGIPLQVGLQAWALTMTSAHHSGWIIGVSPVSTAVLAAFFLRERVTRSKALGVALGFAGVVTVMSASAQHLASGASGDLRGDLLVLVSALNWSCYTLMARSLMKRLPSLPVTVGVYVSGAAATTLIYFAAGRAGEFGRLPAGDWALLAFLGIGCSGLGYLCWSAALEHIEASRLSAFQNVQPLVAAAAAAAWVGESLGGLALAGGVLVLTGVVLVQRSGHATPPCGDVLERAAVDEP